MVHWYTSLWSQLLASSLELWEIIHLRWHYKDMVNISSSLMKRTMKPGSRALLQICLGRDANGIVFCIFEDMSWAKQLVQTYPKMTRPNWINRAVSQGKSVLRICSPESTLYDTIREEWFLHYYCHTQKYLVKLSSFWVQNQDLQGLLSFHAVRFSLTFNASMCPYAAWAVVTIGESEREKRA